MCVLQLKEGAVGWKKAPNYIFMKWSRDKAVAAAYYT